MSEVKPLVAIHCLVYNHEPYLRDCFEGFVMQQTNFPFVAIVHDDASTDGSATIIREYAEKYPHIFQPIYEDENLFQKGGFGAIELVMNAAIDAIGAKYVAMCEGDDYWIDALKLQKQVEFMENNSNYSMCFHAAEVKNETKNQRIIISCQQIEEKEYFISEVFPCWIIPTASVLYRKIMVDNYPELKNIHWMKYADIVLFLKCMKTGRVWGMNAKMSVYRMTDTGAVQSQYMDSKNAERTYRHYKFLLLNFPHLDKSVKYCISQASYSCFKLKSINILKRMIYLYISFVFSPKFLISKLKKIKIK